MKLTTKELRQIIKEELNDVLEVIDPIDGYEKGCEEKFNKCMEEFPDKGDKCYDLAYNCNLQSTIMRIKVKTGERLDKKEKEELMKALQLQKADAEKTRSDLQKKDGGRLFGHLNSIEGAANRWLDVKDEYEDYLDNPQPWHSNNSAVIRNKREGKKALNKMKWAFFNARKGLINFKKKLGNQEKFMELLKQIETVFPIVKRIKIKELNRGWGIEITDEDIESWHTNGWKIR